MILNLKQMDSNQAKIFDVVESFEKINKRDNEHKMKAIVKMKIEVENLIQDNR